MDCPNAAQLLEKYPYRIIQTKWSSAVKSDMFVTTIKINGKDDVGIVNRITELIANQLRITMQSINFSTTQGSFEGEIQLKLLSKEDLDSVIRKILDINGVTKVTRLS